MPDDLYHTDTLAWSRTQAERLRRVAAGERVNDVDWEYVIEEVEGVGRGEFQAVESLLDVPLTRLMAAYGAARPEPVARWRSEARSALGRAARRASPSMVPRLDLQDLWALARESALDKLAADGGPARPLPETCPSTAPDLLNRRPDIDALLARIATAATG